MTAKINLLPPELKASRRIDWGRHLTILAVVLVMAAPVAYWASLFIKTTQANKATAAAKAKFATYSEVLAKDKRLAEMERSLADKKRFIQELNSPLRWAGMLYEVTTYIPATIVLDEIRSLGGDDKKGATATSPAAGQATPSGSGTQSGVAVPPIADHILFAGRAGSLEAIGQFMVGIQNSKYLSSPELNFAIEEEGGFKFEVVAAIRR